ncbi:MAG: recombination protein RecR [Clostridia bacterium]|nr:recombination protein RecR [Clostridia bacterium]
MADYHLTPLEELTDLFRRLPGTGRKTARRLAFYLLNSPEEEVQAFADGVVNARRAVCTCHICQNLSDRDPCGLCTDMGRDLSTVCVVEEPKDVVALERAGEYRGVYHVLHGRISPMDGVGPDELRIAQLLERLSQGNIGEVILATSAGVEGEATTLYLSRLIKPFGVKVTRLAYGLPVGSDLEYADEVTLMRALEGRKEM